MACEPASVLGPGAQRSGLRRGEAGEQPGFVARVTILGSDHPEPYP